MVAVIEGRGLTAGHVHVNAVNKGHQEIAVDGPDHVTNDVGQGHMIVANTGQGQGHENIGSGKINRIDVGVVLKRKSNTV